MPKIHPTSIERFLWILVAGLTVFFARWQSPGLQPDAALYAGFAQKVLFTGEHWVIHGTKFFETFHDHPPFFFIWGAEWLKHFGSSDGSARAMGGFFGFSSFVILGVWLWLRFDWVLAVTSLFFVATTGHFTKYASSSMLEAPLSFGVMLVAIGAYELHWKPRSGIYRPFWLALTYFGLIVATASKGLAGLGAWGALCLSLALAFFYSPRSPRRIFLSFFTLSFALLMALIPFAVWAWETYKAQGANVIFDYIFNQVVKSAISNRGEIDIHPIGGNHWYYVGVFLHYGWPWFWTFVLAWCCLPFAAVFRSERAVRVAERLKRLGNHPFRGLAINSLAFAMAFVLPFSFVSFQLPHYVHPIYLIALPVGAYLMLTLIPQTWLKWIGDWRPRWILVLVGAVVLMSVNTQSADANRGQPFAQAAPLLARTGSECVVVVSQDTMDPYRMEAYSLWYWKGRKWDFVTQPYLSDLSVPTGKTFWNPFSGEIFGRGECGPG